MSKMVLVVDDNELNVRLFCDLLRLQGYRTLQAGNGAEGLELARTHRPNLIIMDIELPVMCGRDAVGRVRQDSELRGIPIIAVTAFASDELKATMQAMGCDAYLEKPIQAGPFLTTVRQFLD